jgi:hypothetical protein
MVNLPLSKWAAVGGLGMASRPEYRDYVDSVPPTVGNVVN